MESVGLSDMETSLDYCLRIKGSCKICSFLRDGDARVEQEIAPVLYACFLAFCENGEYGVIVLVRMSKRLFRFLHGKGRKKKQEGKHGQEVVLCLRICFIVCQAGRYSTQSNNAGHFTPPDKDTSDLTTAADASFGWLVNAPKSDGFS